MSRPAIALFKKDLRVTRIFWAPMAFSYGVFLVMFMELRWVYLATASMLAFLASVTALGIDDRYQSGLLDAALPGTRRSLVGGRYLSWGVFTAASLSVFLAFTALIRAGFGERAPRLASLLSVKGAAAFLVATVLAGIVFLPFHFRFGFWRGMWSFTAAGLVLSIVGLHAAARLVPSEACAPDPASSMPGPFASTVRGLRALAWFIDRRMDRPAVVAAAVVILASLTFISYRISVRFYSGRDL